MRFPSSKKELAATAVAFALRYWKKKLSSGKVEKIQVTYQDGKTEQLVCNPVQRKTK